MALNKNVKKTQRVGPIKPGGDMGQAGDIKKSRKTSLIRRIVIIFSILSPLKKEAKYP